MALSFWIAAAIQYAMRSTIRLPGSKSSSLSPPQGIFALQKSLRGNCGGDGVPAAVGNAPPAQRNFQRKFALRRVGSSKSVVPPRLPSTQKYVTMPDWENLRTGQPRGARGTAVPLFREESRGTPFKGFLWATSSRRLDTALLFADKKRGVETTRLAGHCQSTPGPWTTGPAKKPPAAGRQQKNRRTFVRRFSLPYLLLYALMPRASRSMARSSLSCLRM